jgi:hypothetical protein
MKSKILISNDSDKQFYYKLLDGVDTKTAAYKLLDLCDNTYGKKELDRIAKEVGFDLNIYIERRQKPIKICKLCGKKLKKGQTKFCSSSCSATYNNLQRDRKVYESVSAKLKKEKQIKQPKQRCEKHIVEYKHICKYCNKEFINNKPISKYCSCECSSLHKHQISYKDFLENNNKYCRGNYTPKSFKKEFMEEQNNVCAICGSKPEHNGKPLVFVLDHIDGDASNNRRENLRMICPNCDSQLDTFKSKNKNSRRRNYWKEKIIRDIQENV